MPTVTINGVQCPFTPGQTILQAANAAGVDIPFYCYHDGLSIVASCRICLGEVWAPNPRNENRLEPFMGGKLLPTCQTPASDGMVVHTDSPKAVQNQKAVMEYLLINHPLDCPVCDQAGECLLQDYSFKYGRGVSRFQEQKVKNPKKDLGPHVYLYADRCIMCTRCVRFMSEVAKAPQLGVFGRGSHEVIDVAPEYGKLESNYSGNIVDICPVGALLNRDFRFRARAWFLSAAPSVCTGCSRGCSTVADFMGQDVYRYRPRENEAINKSWLCDQGRLSYKSLNTHRVPQAVLGRGADAKEAPAAEAIKYAAMKLQPLLGSVAFLASPVASNEDLLAGFAFARDVLKTSTVYVGGRADGQADFLLMQADKNPNRRGLEWIAKAFGLTVQPFDALTKALDADLVKALFALGHEVPEADDAWAARTEKLELFVLSATNESKATGPAHVVLPAATHVEDEGTFTQADGITQRFRRAFPPRGEARPHWRWVAELAKELGNDLAVASSREVFKKLAPSVPELASFEWDKQAPVNQTRPGISTMAAASDGRPPGWREQGVPNLRGLSIP